MAQLGPARPCCSLCSEGPQVWRSSVLNNEYNEREMVGGGGEVTCSVPVTAFTPGVLPLLGERPVPAVPAAAVVSLPAPPPLLPLLLKVFPPVKGLLLPPPLFPLLLNTSLSGFSPTSSSYQRSSSSSLLASGSFMSKSSTSSSVPVLVKSPQCIKISPAQHDV